MLSLSKNNRYRIAVEKWTIDIASLWKLTIAEVYTHNKILSLHKYNINLEEAKAVSVGAGIEEGQFWYLIVDKSLVS